MRVLRVLGLAVALAGGWTADAAAQARRPPPRSSSPALAEREAPAYSGRNAPSPPRQGQDGVIRWNTPNASGNLGGPSTGGSSGGSP